MASAVIVQGEGLGAWVAAQHTGFERLVPAQQWVLTALGIQPAATAEEPQMPARPRRWQAGRRALGLAAARQFHTCEGRLTVPCKHVETVGGVEVRLGNWPGNARAALTASAPSSAQN
ncbi:hypothetical protein [Streptomyces sp. NPDC002559]